MTCMQPASQASQVTVTHEAQPPSDPWTAVVDPSTGGTYYWNQQTDEVTAVGEAKPVGFYRETQPSGGVPEYQPVSFLGQISGMFLWGMGITFGFAIVGVLFRMLFG